MEDLNVKQLVLAIRTIADEKNLPEDTVMDVVQQAVAAAGYVVPQALEGHGVHAREVKRVYRHKHRQLAVQAQGGGRACGLGAGHQVVHPVGQGRDGLFVLQMFARNVLAGAGLARLHGGVHKLVLVVQVRAAQVVDVHVVAHATTWATATGSRCAK